MTLQDQFEEDFASIWKVNFCCFQDRLNILKSLRNNMYSYTDESISFAWESYRMAYQRFKND